MLTIETTTDFCSSWHGLEADGHRLDGPALTLRHYNGQKDSERYFVSGRFHRAHGPAYKAWRKDGREEAESYWENDKRIQC